MWHYKRTFLYCLFKVSLFVFMLFIAWQITETPGRAENLTQQNVSTRVRVPNPTDNQMVVIDGRSLFRLIGIESYPAKKRAKKVAMRIKQLAEDPSFDPDMLVVREKNGIYTIFGNDLPVVRLTAEDVLLEGDFPLESFAEQLVKKQIARAIKEYRHERLPEIIRKNVLKAFIRTSALIIILVLLFWSFKKSDELLERYFKRRIEHLESKSKHILKAQQIWRVLKFIINFSRVVLVIAVIYIFLNFVLSLFPWTRVIASTLLSYTLDPLQTLWQSFVDYLPNLFFLVIIYLFFDYLLKITKAFFNQIERGQIIFSEFDAAWALPTFRLVRILIVVLGLVIAYPYIPGSGSEAFRGISIFAGLLLSLGSSSLIANIIAGYAMIYRKAFKVGDRVKIGDYIGDVTNVRLLETHIKSLKNEEIVIPNSQILSGEVTNYSSLADEQGLILHTVVGIGYEVPWRQVKAMLLIAAERTAGLQPGSEPFVQQKQLGDFGVLYELNVFCCNVEKMVQIYSDLHCNIQDVFNEYDVAIMTPHYVGDTETPKTVPKDKWFAPPAQQP